MPNTNKKYRKQFRYQGKTYEVYGNTEEEAIMKKANKLRDLENSSVLVESSMSVKDWSEKAVTTYKSHLSPRGLKSFKQICDRMNKEIGSMPLKSVKPVHCQNVLNNMAGYSRDYIGFMNQALNFTFKTAKHNGLINNNPADDLIIPKGYTNERRALTDYEREIFYKALPLYKNFALFQFCLECGCRPSEAANLQHRDLIIENGEYLLHIRGTKTKNSDRYVPLPKELYSRWKTGSPFDFLFVTEGNHIYDENAQKRLRKRLYREMNILMGCRMYRNKLIPPYPLAEDFVPYMFRHTYCTDLCDKGVDIRIAAKLMGHSSIEITYKIYTHASKKHVIKAAKQLRESTQ